MANPPDLTSWTGRRLCDRYRITGGLGTGGSAMVFEALDESRQARVALKVLNASASKRKGLQFRREYQAMSRLHHRNIVRVDEYAVDRAHGHFYTMELLDGGDVGDSALPSADALAQLLYDIASSLAFLHAKRLIHRDVSTRNVRFAADGTAKLIDFGLLSTPGVVVREMAGTPPFIAPETLWGGELDPRVDLFSLGALAYRYWTGKHAFPARSTDELPDLWEAPLASPAALRPGLSPEVDALIVQLLSRDPLGRPTSAVEVADRAAAAAARPLSERDAARAYLTSCELIGRARELHVLRQSISALSEGRGSVVCVQAPSGFGKSRLLREAVVEARTSGFHSLTVECGTKAAGPYGVLKAIVHRLGRERPRTVQLAAAESSPWLARLFPELAADAGLGQEPPPLQDPADDRMHLLAALTTFFLGLSRQEPLVLALDDFQRCDAGSSLVLAAALDHNPDFLLVLGLRTDEALSGGDAVRRLLAEAELLPLDGLSRSDVEQLVEATFGPSVAGNPLAPVLHRITGGNPMHCVFVMQSLVDTNKVRYIDGEWLVTGEVTAQDLPGHLTDAALGQWDLLASHAQRMGERLAIVGARCSFDLAEALSHDEIEGFFDAVAELCLRGFLLADDQEVRFRHDGVREALLRRLEAAEKEALHYQVADALIADRELVGTSSWESEVGWHLYHAGKKSDAASFLHVAGVRLWEAQAFVESIPPLEVALEHGARLTTGEALDLRQRLLSTALFAEARLAERYGHETLTALARLSGIAGFTARASRLGPRLAFLAGILGAVLRWLFVGVLRREPSPAAAVRQLVICTTFTMAVECARDRWHRASGLARVLEPIAAFRRSTGRTGDLMVKSFYDLMMGHLASALSKMDELEVLLNSRPWPRLEAWEEAQAKGAIRYTRTFVAASDHAPACLEHLNRVRELGLPFFDLSGRAALVVYHRLRGEESIAQAMEADVRPKLTQLSSWLPEVQLTWFSGVAYALHGNASGLKSTLATLEVAAERGRLDPSVVAYFSGEYDRLRGRYRRALTRLERALSEIPEDERILRPSCLAAIAACLRKEGRLSEAEANARRGIEIANDPRCGRVSGTFRAELELASILAERHRFEDAEGRLRELERRVTPLESPALIGLVAEARAKVSWAAGDRPAFVHQLTRAIEILTPTQNPSLLARVLELRQRAEGADLFQGSHDENSVSLSAAPSGGITGSSTADSEITVVDRVARRKEPFDDAEGSPSTSGVVPRPPRRNGG